MPLLLLARHGHSSFSLSLSLSLPTFSFPTCVIRRPSIHIRATSARADRIVVLVGHGECTPEYHRVHDAVGRGEGTRRAIRRLPEATALLLASLRSYFLPEDAAGRGKQSANHGAVLLVRNSTMRTPES
jgi:hypothetical protein